ncbi:hypothetical protein [Planosporangium mesophilum]|uniref:Uncharacterized protein n=1 Tax=Planosporangium mesophilum TaxID=689768 RepID=A0A8J3TF85_9ACTN|nr:hypothetical protein [Planosporangium mesophilum]NJC86253.1 hypothetical protein [Planosporangium mesophilum]GII25778.1 hypothetical protein Pme01_53750 [Planosporangium mesophilum]
MISQTALRLDRRTAEQLLAGDPTAGRDSHPPLAALLTAAAAPGRPDELARERVSMAAFQTACLTPAPRPGRLDMVKTAVLKVLTVKVLAIAAVTAGTGGVALAASTGVLPNPLAGPAPSASSGLTVAHPTAGSSRHTHEAGRDDATSNDAVKAPSPSLVGLCHAYGAGNKAEHGKALDNPAFSVLATAAGGRDKVDAFCQALVATPADGGAAKPGGKAGKDHPTGPPADHGSKPEANPKR